MQFRLNLIIDVGTLVSSGVDGSADEPIVSDDDDNHFLGGIKKESLNYSGITMDEEGEEKPCISYSSINPSGDTIQPDLPCKKEEVEKKILEKNNKPANRSGIDYKGIWINNSMPCVVAEINSGKLLKGNTFFMK